MKFCRKLINPAAWCFRCAFIAIAWSTLSIIITGIILYIEYLQSTATHVDNLAELSQIHAVSIVVALSILWIVGLICTFGCMILMRQGVETQCDIEMELRQERNLAQEYLDIAAVIIVVLDPYGCIRLLNKRGHELLEREGEDLTGYDWFDLCVPPRERDKVRQTFNQLVTGVPEEYYENSITTQSGSERLIAWRNTILYNDEGRCTGTLSSGLDITTQEEVSTELRRSCEDLAEKNAELARFVYTVSHDLKSPLVTIKGYIGLMLDNIQDKSYPEVQQNARTIGRAADKMQQLLEELLELSRIGRVRGDYICKPLNEVIDDVLLSLDGLCEEKQPEIIIQPDMPELCGDRARMGELVQNLIENAIKYGGGRGSPVIEISGWVENKETVCCVSDNGIGIEEAYLEKIFDLFEKLDPETPGSGVGLAVAKRIVEVHHGRIWCESSGPGQGSKFYISIPQQSCEPV